MYPYYDDNPANGSQLLQTFKTRSEVTRAKLVTNHYAYATATYDMIKR